MSSTYGTEYPLRVQNLYNSSQITRNTLYGKTYSFYASSVIGTSTLRALIANNAATAHQTNFNSCYAFYTQSNQYCDVFHNSAFSANQYASSGYTTYAFYNGSSTYTTVQNNIFRDSSSISMYSYAAYLASSTGTTYDYNDYFVQSGNTYLAYHNSFGNFTPAQWSSFRSSGYGGVNSLNINPNWFTPFNLRHRNSSLNAGNNQLTLVGVDIDGSTRSTPVTIGSDEYKSTGIDAGITQIVSTPPCVGVGNVVVQLNNHGTTTLTSTTINWSINSISF
jgi:hypothetical protein